MDNSLDQESSAARQRQLRRRYMRSRQIVIFGWIFLGMWVIFLVAIPFAAGWLSLPFGQTFSLSEAAKAKVPPCTPTGDPLPLEGIKVSVYNASSQNGLARQTADRLETFGIKIATVANATDPYAGSVRVTCGREGVKQAFSVARTLPDADVRLDPKLLGASVNVLLGEQFEGALSTEMVGKAGLGKMPASPKECQVID